MTVSSTSSVQAEHPQYVALGSVALKTCDTVSEAVAASNASCRKIRFFCKEKQDDDVMTRLFFAKQPTPCWVQASNLEMTDGICLYVHGIFFVLQW